MSIFEKFFAKLTKLGETPPKTTAEIFEQEQKKQSDLSKERYEAEMRARKESKEKKELKEAEEEIGEIKVEGEE